MNILDEYVKKYPNPQNIIDIFEGEWACSFNEFKDIKTSPGFADLSNDDRINWAVEKLGAIEGKTVLELGPLEAVHTYMISKKGVKEVIAIEANQRAFLKCLCIKEIMDIKNAKFLLGDFHEYLEKCTRRYDIVFASGVLYHSTKPIELIKNISKATDKVFIWSMYYDKKIINNRIDLKKNFSSLKKLKYDGEKYYYSEHHYEQGLNIKYFCGGSNTSSIWLTKDSILKALEKNGFRKISINFDEPNHQNGPSIGICAER
jgi:hypothetical protein